VVCRGHPYGTIQYFPIFQSVPPAEIDVQIGKNGKVGAGACIFVMKWLLEESLSQAF
jgi:hypothetical protein